MRRPRDGDEVGDDESSGKGGGGNGGGGGALAALMKVMMVVAVATVAPISAHAHIHLSVMRTYVGSLVYEVFVHSNYTVVRILVYYTSVCLRLQFRCEENERKTKKIIGEIRTAKPSIRGRER